MGFETSKFLQTGLFFLLIAPTLLLAQGESTPVEVEVNPQLRSNYSARVSGTGGPGRLEIQGPFLQRVEAEAPRTDGQFSPIFHSPCADAFPRDSRLLCVVQGTFSNTGLFPCTDPLI